ncbi:MAG: hypothetical protein U0872_11730 [Planctomycetaceae bacterium]
MASSVGDERLSNRRVSLLPLVLFPLLGIQSAKSASALFQRQLVPVSGRIHYARHRKMGPASPDKALVVISILA